MNLTLEQLFDRRANRLDDHAFHQERINQIEADLEAVDLEIAYFGPVEPVNIITIDKTKK